jgi:Tfp pilus assembly protein PilE
MMNSDQSKTVSGTVLRSVTTTTDSYGTKESTRMARKAVFGSNTSTMESYFSKESSRIIKDTVLGSGITAMDSCNPKESTRTARKTVLGSGANCTEPSIQSTRNPQNGVKGQIDLCDPSAR